MKPLGMESLRDAHVKQPERIYTLDLTPAEAFHLNDCFGLVSSFEPDIEECALCAAIKRKVELALFPTQEGRND